MTEQQEQRAKEFFSVLAAHGITNVFVLNPPKGGEVVGKIESAGDVTMVDKRDGKRKKVKMV